MRIEVKVSLDAEAEYRAWVASNCLPPTRRWRDFSKPNCWANWSGRRVNPSVLPPSRRPQMRTACGGSTPTHGYGSWFTGTDSA